MTEALHLEGTLWLICQEGGFAQDAFVLVPTDMELVTVKYGKRGSQREPESYEELVTKGVAIDDLVASHFGTERERFSGNRYVGPVRITIEHLGSAEKEGTPT